MTVGEDRVAGRDINIFDRVLEKRFVSHSRRLAAPLKGYIGFHARGRKATRLGQRVKNTITGRTYFNFLRTVDVPSTAT